MGFLERQANKFGLGSPEPEPETEPEPEVVAKYEVASHHRPLSEEQRCALSSFFLSTVWRA